jgi:hypothetical protein
MAYVIYLFQLQPLFVLIPLKIYDINFMVIIFQAFLLRYQLTLMDKFPTIENHFVFYTFHLTYSQMEKGGM